MSARTYAVMLVVGLIGCAGTAKQANVQEPESGPSSTASGEPQEADTARTDPNDEGVDELLANRCAARMGERDDMLVLSKKDGYATLLFGTDWAIECNDEKLFAAQSPGGTHVTIQDFDPGGPIVVPDHLEDLASRVAARMSERGFPATQPSPLKIQAGHQTVDAIFVSIDLGEAADQVVQLNYWTSRQRADGIVLDFHISTLAHMNQPQETMNATILLMERTTGLFTLLEDLD
ncbi:MAG: hypothetical protein AAF436_21975, partial [Myxococcota bacterium]